MSGGKPVSVVLIPPYLFRVYLTETGLLPRFQYAASPGPGGPSNPGRRPRRRPRDRGPDLRPPAPRERLRESLRELLAPLGPDLVLWTPPEDPGSGEAEFFPAGSAAGALDSLRRAWAWLDPGTIRAGRFPDIPGR